jgi:hypothetical protein
MIRGDSGRASSTASVVASVRAATYGPGGAVTMDSIPGIEASSPAEAMLRAPSGIPRLVVNLEPGSLQSGWASFRRSHRDCR